MKRSEIVELINESYCEYAFGDSDEIRESEDFGDFILTRLEKAGMLPPSKGYIPNSSLIHSNCIIDMLNYRLESTLMYVDSLSWEEE